MTSGSFAGAEMMTCLAPAERCLPAPSRSVKRPVDSMTMSTFRSFQGSSFGSLTASTLIGFAIDENLIFLGFDASLQGAVHGVVLQEIGECLGVCEVVDRDELQFRIAERRAQDVTSDPAKSVDSNRIAMVRGVPPRKNRPVNPGRDDGDSIDGSLPCQAVQKW